MVLRQFQRYEDIGRILHTEQGIEADESGEDARYVLPLCVTTQMGLTINARSLEYMLQNASAAGLHEFRRFGNRLYNVVDGVAPSIVKYTEGTALLSKLPRQLARLTADLIPEPTPAITDDVTLVHTSPNPDAVILTALISRNESVVGGIHSSLCQRNGSGVEKAVFH